MSIPKIKRTLAPGRKAPDAAPKRGHYFDPEPQVASHPQMVRLHVGADLDLKLQSDRGVFGSRRVDLGTLTLLREAPPPPAEGDILDLGSGYGPIAIALARAAPRARIWAVDVNQRALELTRVNAVAAGVGKVTACLPDEVPADVRFAAIYSNPPVRIGKALLHELLERWLDRLGPSGQAYLVVQRNLGADSLAAWLATTGRTVERLKSKKGYRILRVTAPAA